MIIRSIRLLNIKSYGEAADGKGITIQFAPGINRIAGRNGHGKSTIIESLGYALFLTDPIYEEGFDAATYLLRSGKKVGEIDVVFEINGMTYRLERGLGSQNKRRAKVVLVNDGSTEAEGDKQVAEYLRRLLGCCDDGRFSELFAKLVGVKQGRLTWPFDSKPGEARKHFEPLLDVEIFRQCFDRLKPVVDRFETLKMDREKELARIEERIKERVDSPEKVKARQHDVESLAKSVEAIGKEKQIADQNRQVHERKEHTYREAKVALDTTHNELKLASQRKQQEQSQAQESLDSVAIVKATQLNYEVHSKAELALHRLQEQQTQKSRLEKQRGEATNLKTEREGKAKSARQQASNYDKQKTTRNETAQKLKKDIVEIRKALLETKTDFERFENSTANAEQSRDALEHWLDALEIQIDSNVELLSEILADRKTFDEWKPDSLAKARAREEQFDKNVKTLLKKLTEAEKLKETTAEQLEQIQGGVCPFLKEKCRQFDPKKIQSDVSIYEREIKRLTKEHEEAANIHRQATKLVEQLGKEEAKLAQLRKSADKNVEAFLKTHNKLFPSQMEKHFGVLRDYIPKQTGRLTIKPLSAANATECYDGTGALKIRVLKELAVVAKQFHAQVVRIFENTADGIGAEIKSFEKQRDDRLRKERDLNNKQEKLTEIDDEIKELTAHIETQNKLGRQADEEASVATKRISDFDDKLRSYANLERELEEQRKLKSENAEGHKKYLGAKPSADRLEQRQQALKTSTAAEIKASDLVRQRQTAFDQAKGEFDAKALELARKKREESAQQLATASANLENAKRELAREQARFAEWQKATEQREDMLIACGKLVACVELTQKARHILQRAAPMVAQHVCQRIAGRAQQTFNQINGDPIELEWNSERYSLRINPGDRRFAMLSGGEQTKLALAMTLAMIQEFCGLKFCIFDEPTYGVDADSRHKLADAIVRLQDVNESKLDQILLVSHDDAFEGKIENVVMICKTANEGSAPLLNV